MYLSSDIFVQPKKFYIAKSVLEFINIDVCKCTGFACIFCILYMYIVSTNVSD